MILTNTEEELLARWIAYTVAAILDEADEAVLTAVLAQQMMVDAGDVEAHQLPNFRTFLEPYAG